MANNAKRKDNSVGMSDQSNRQPQGNMESNRKVQNNAEVGAPSESSTRMEQNYNRGNQSSSSREGVSRENRGSNLREFPRRDQSSNRGEQSSDRNQSRMLDSDSLTIDSETAQANDRNSMGSRASSEMKSSNRSDGQSSSLRDREREEDENPGADIHAREARDESMEEQSWKVAKSDLSQSSDRERENSGELGVQGQGSSHIENRSGDLNLDQHSSNATPSGRNRDAKNKGSRKRDAA
jgi:hypothetical protein